MVGAGGEGNDDMDASAMREVDHAREPAFEETLFWDQPTCPAPGQVRILHAHLPTIERETAEGRFWRSFRRAVTSQQIGAVTSIDVCQAAPHNFAATSSTRVVVFDSVTRKPKKVFSRFKDIAYSGSFRPDGQVVVAGGETGIVQVFDANSRAVLRQLKGHTQAVHFVRYGAEKLHLLSASDDKSVRWWDIASQECVVKLHGHTDYVRCGALSPANADLWATGSYDHSIRLWDIRLGKSVMELDHGQPLEDVVFFPSGGILASAGGNSIDIWDVVGGGRRLRRLQNHQKTVTVLHMCTPRSSSRNLPPAVGPRLLSGSLDGHVKIFDLASLKVTHAIKYPSPILSLAITPDASTLAVGMSDGSLSLRRRAPPKAPSYTLATGEGATEKEKVASARAKLLGIKPKKKKTRPRVLRATSYRYFTRGQNAKSAAGDFRYQERKKAHLASHDRFLRQFQYADALTSALATKHAEVVVSVIEELVARGGLRSALSNRTTETLEPLLSFLAKVVTNPRHSSVLVLVAHMLLDMYASVFAQSPALDSLVVLLRERVMVESRLQQSLSLLQGLLSPLIHASSTATSA